MNWTQLIGIFLFSYTTTLFLSQWVLGPKIRTFFLDQPDAKRKIHQTATPRTGGIPFSISILALMWFFDMIGQYQWFILGGFAILILGLIDDRYVLSWKVKTGAQLIFGLCIAQYFIPKIDMVTFFGADIVVTPILMTALYVLWFLGVANAVNLIDGMDGLAGGMMLLIGFAGIVLGLELNSSSFVMFNVILVATLLAFLQFNSKPAKFFMGDSGSLFLGYILAVYPFLYFDLGGQSQVLNVTMGVIMVSYLIVDTLRVFLVRIKAGKNPLKPGTEHLHHHLLTRTGSYQGTLFIIFILITVSLTFALESVNITNERLWMLIYIAILVAMVFSTRIKDGFLKLSQVFVDGIRGFVQARTLRVKNPPNVIVGLLFFCLVGEQLFYLLVRAEQKLSLGHIELWIAVLLLILYILLYFRRPRLSFTLLMLPLLLFGLNLSLDPNILMTPLNGGLFLIAAFVLLWIGLSSFNRLLFRYWTVYDMGILFSGIIFLSNSLSKMTLYAVLQFGILYLFSKIIFSPLGTVAK